MYNAAGLPGCRGARNGYLANNQYRAAAGTRVRELIFIKVKTQTGGRARPRIWYPDLDWRQVQIWPNITDPLSNLAARGAVQKGRSSGSAHAGTAVSYFFNSKFARKSTKTVWRARMDAHISL